MPHSATARYRLCFIILVVFLFGKAYGQDTVSVYFDVNHSKLNTEQLEILHSLSSRYDLTSVDSVHFIGITDSSGNFNANLILSEKRAKNVRDYCLKQFPPGILFRVFSEGEKKEGDKSKNRRVDLIFYFTSETTLSQEEGFFTKRERCFYVDYALLHQSHVSTVMKGGHTFVRIEAPLHHFSLKDTRKYFRGSLTPNGQFKPVRIKWSSEKTGKLWWAKKSYVTLIPQKDFDQFFLFKYSNPPCSVCSEDFFSFSQLTKHTTCMQVDHAIMQNIQFKPLFFNKKEVVVRVPREYVNPDYHYYIGCDADQPLHWATRKGRKKKHYYYASLPVQSTYVNAVSRLMNCCVSMQEHTDCKLKISSHLNGKQNYKQFTIIAETGVHYQQSAFTPYIGAGLSYTLKEALFTLLAGTDTGLNLYSTLRFQYQLLHFRISGGLSRWSFPAPPSLQKLTLYAGSELKTKIGAPSKNHLEYNLHTGFAALNIFHERIQRLFLQTGLGFDLTKNYTSRSYPIFQLGINIRIR